MRILILLMSFYFAPAYAEEVYRSVDETGSVIYTDKPSADAEVITIDKVQTVETPDAPEIESSTGSANTPAPAVYTKLEIISPADGAAFESGAGDVNISVSVEPGLLPGHKLTLFMDGAVAGEGGTQFNLTNIDRGTHILNASITDAGGAELMRSASTSFTVHRHSKKHNVSIVGKPPKPKAAPKPPPTP